MPPGSGAIHPDHVAGRVLAAGTVAALLAREGHGAGGCHVEVAQVETLINLLADLFLAESLRPGTVGPEGNRSRRGAPWGVYPCQGEERWCVITVRDDTDWRALRRALGDPGWAHRPELETVAGRHAAHDELDRKLGEWTAARTDRDATAVLQAAGVPAGFMAYPADLVCDEHAVARNFPQIVDQPPIGPFVVEGPALEASGMPPPVTEPAPGPR
jgi:crotonobetainyl-CoA:carnitine CoA-transferase CaiB-like acyl-CoA transferase